MSDLNVWVMAGRVATDPETKTIGDQKVTEFRIACDQSRKKDEDSTLWITGVLWGQEGKLPWITKGKKVLCSGSLRQREWQTQDGQRRSVIELVVREIDPFFANPKVETSTPSKPVGSSAGDEDIPFGPSVI